MDNKGFVAASIMLFLAALFGVILLAEGDVTNITNSNNITNIQNVTFLTNFTTIVNVTSTANITLTDITVSRINWLQTNTSGHHVWEGKYTRFSGVATRVRLTCGSNPCVIFVKYFTGATITNGESGFENYTTAGTTVSRAQYAIAAPSDPQVFEHLTRLIDPFSVYSINYTSPSSNGGIKEVGIYTFGTTNVTIENGAN